MEIYLRESPTYAFVLETYVDVYQHIHDDDDFDTTINDYYIRRRSHLETAVLHEITPGDECDPKQDYLPEKKFMLTFRKQADVFLADLWCDGFDVEERGHRRGTK